MCPLDNLTSGQHRGVRYFNNPNPNPIRVYMEVRYGQACALYPLAALALTQHGTVKRVQAITTPAAGRPLRGRCKVI